MLRSRFIIRKLKYFCQILLCAWSVVFAIFSSWVAATYWLEHRVAIDSFAVAQFRNSAKNPSPPIECGAIEQIKDINERETWISCQFKLHRPENIRTNGLRYMNLFQTAASGTGLRVEFTINPETTGVWGLVFDDPNHKVVGITLSHFPSYEEWHSLDIYISARHIQIRLNGNLIYDSEAIALTYLTSDVAVGSGYSKSRPFDGEIQDFSITTYRRNPMLRAWIWHTRQLLPLSTALVLLLHLLVLVSSETRSTACLRLDQLVAYGVSMVLYTYLNALIFSSSPYDLVWDALFALALLLMIKSLARLTIRIHWVLNRVIVAIIAVLMGLGYAGLCLLHNYWSRLAPATKGHFDKLNFDEIGAIYQSNPLEVIGFFYSTFTGSELFIALACGMVVATAAVRLAWIHPEQSFPFSRNLIIGGVALATGFIANYDRPNLINILRPAFHEFQLKAHEFDLFVEYRRNTSAHVKIAATKEGKGETYVVVIGESANPAHFGAYDYFRATTPWLSSKVADPSWLIFQNAYASYCHTIPSLLMALTGANQYNEINDFHSPSLIETFKAAGFKTYWLSEQGVSWLDSPLNALASGADKFQIVRPIGGIPALLDKTLTTVNRNDNNLIIVHLIGSHAPYSTRIPVGYEPDFIHAKIDLRYLDHGRPDFVKDVLNPYDASIHYTDWILSQIDKILRDKISSINTFVYFSDHGEDVLGGKAHNASLFTYPMVRIPLIISASSAWRKLYPQKFALLSQRRDRVFTLDMFFELMTGLASIHTPLSEPRFDFTLPDYEIDFENALTMRPSSSLQLQLYPNTQPQRISNDPWLITKRNIAFLQEQYGDKFLGVKADNALTPANGVRLGLHGVEINITVPNMTIGHYPEEVSETQLDQYLHEKPFTEFHKIWFDTKLVAGRKLAECLSAFEEIDRKHHVKQRAILESWESGLRLFSDSGWKTSYYIHEKIWPELDSQNEEALQNLAKKIAEKVILENAKAVSFFAKDYPFVKKHLESLLPAEVGYLTWSLDIPPINDPSFREKTLDNEIMSDPRVETVLIEALGIN